MLPNFGPDVKLYGTFPWFLSWNTAEAAASTAATLDNRPLVKSLLLLS